MANLTEISITTKKLLIWTVVIFLVYLFFRITLGFAIQYWKKTHPIPILPPNVLFGKILPPRFPSKLSTSGMIFKLENIEGRPPETTMAGKVYSMPKKLPTFLSSEKAQKLAVKLGFTSNPEIINSTYYHYIDPNDNLRSFDLDITNLNFKLKYDYLNNIGDFFSNLEILSKEKALGDIKNFIRFNNLFDESVLNGKISTDILKFDPITNKFIPASSLSNSQSLRINFFRQDLDNMKILPPEFNKSYNFAIYSPNSIFNKQILELSYAFWSIDYNNYATYPLKSGSIAWQDLIDGYASVVSFGQNNNKEIIIRKIYLSYYDSEEPQLYLQPIFVFEGDNDFIAYLPAITTEWLE